MNITGEIKHDNGEVSQFSVSSTDYTQWGASTETLEESVDLMWEMMMMARDKEESWTLKLSRSSRTSPSSTSGH